jgi:hypothetical protein
MTREERGGWWAEQLAAQAGSGLTVRSWCIREGVCYGSFLQWRRRLGAAAAMEGPLSFVQVLPAEAKASTVRVRVGSAWIEVTAGFDPGLLRRVVEALA